MRLEEQLSASLDSYHTITILAAGLVERDSDKYSIHKHPLALIAALGLPYWEGYYFHRYFDDILDGDIKHYDPVARVASLRAQVVSRSFDAHDPISRLGEQYLTFAQKHNPFPNLDPWQECLRSIDGMLYDYYRGQERVLLTEKRLDTYYDMTFSSVLTITEILQGVLIAPPIKKLLIHGQGKIYSLRDLGEWTAGILNIPSETIDLAGLCNTSKIDEVKNNSVIRQWALETIDDFMMGLHSDEVEQGLSSMWPPHAISEARQYLMCKQLLGNLEKTAQKQKVLWGG